MGRRHILMVGHSPAMHGAEYSLLRLIRKLVYDYRISVIAPDGGPFAKALAEEDVAFYPFQPRYPFAMIHEGRSALPAFLDRVSDNVAHLLPLLKEVDLVHSNTLLVWEGAALAAHLQVPHLWNMREIPQTSPTWRPALGWPMTFNLMSALSEKVVTVSNAAKAALPSSLQNRTAVVPNGLDSTPWPREKARRDLLQRCGLPPSSQLALTIGNLIPEKGHQPWIEAMAPKLKAHSTWHLVFIGEKGFHTPAVLDAVEKHGLQGRVHLLGPIEGAGQLASGADLYVLPSLTEAFPTVLLEAQRAQIPFLAKDCGGSRDIVAKGGGAIGQDHNALANLFEDFIQGQLNVPAVDEEAFTMAKMAQAYGRIYQELFLNAPQPHKLEAWDMLMGLRQDLHYAQIHQQRIDDLCRWRGIGRFFRRWFRPQ